MATTKNKDDGLLKTKNYQLKTNLELAKTALNKMELRKFEMTLNGHKLIAQTGLLAPQANGAITVQYGGTLVLATAVMRQDPSEVNYLPLIVDYEERLYAVGKIKGSRWVKREGRPSEEAILTGRLIDRTLRPRFDQQIRNDIQVITTVLSLDGENDPDMPALLAASLALTTSDIPWQGPLAGVRLAKIEQEIILCPTYEQRQKADYDIFVSGDGQTINMIEAEAKEVAEKDFLEGVVQTQKAIGQMINWQKEISQKVARPKKELALASTSPELRKEIKKYISPRLQDMLYLADKQERNDAIKQIQQEWLDFVTEKYPEDKNEAANLFEQEVDAIVHQNIIQEEKRPDGRKLDEVRPLNMQVGLLPRTHGSALFQRGETQALSILTLAAPGAEQWIEEMETEGKKRFMHHYNFPPYCVGETGPMRGPGRREIGHGALAEKALRLLMPPKDSFPYTIRIVSEILSSNGSSSMASVCGSSLALFDAGVPIKRATAGIAMGMMRQDDGQYKILTDIQGPEDHHGDMDFKIAGTEKGITAAQLDVKITGLDYKIIQETLEQAKKARGQILKQMNRLIGQPREKLSVYAPRIAFIKINPSKIRDLIGPAGKIINKLIEDYDVAIDIEDDGLVYVTAKNEKNIEAVLAKIKTITYEPTVGEKFEGIVVRLLDFGALLEIMPGQSGLLHISELADQANISIHQLVKEGQRIKVIIKEIDALGRLNLALDEPRPKASTRPITRPSDRIFSRPRPYRGPRRKLWGR